MAVFRVTDPEVVTGRARVGKIIPVPPFSHSGVPGVDSVSGIWFPYMAINLSFVQITARTVGTADATFQIMSNVGSVSLAEWANLTDVEHVLYEVVLPANNKYALVQFDENQHTIEKSNWLGIKCVSCDASDIVINIIAREAVIPGSFHQ